jgi:cell wall-associated NlpC family hydrolase
MSVGDRELGIVKRIDDDSLGYVNVEGRSLSFRADEIENYRGQPFAELGITEGATVEFVRDAAARIAEVFPIVVESGAEGPGGLVARSIFTTPQAPDVAPIFTPPPPNESQGELHPDADAKRSRRPGGALPPHAWKFGKLIDTSLLQPGDLLLTRDVTGDNWISRSIGSVQKRLGYGPADAKWVHVAMYMGDGANVVEATVDSLVEGGNVRITPLVNYCDGTNILRFRRSTLIQQERHAWLVCISALSRLGKPYSVGRALKAWLDVRLGAAAYNSEEENILSGGTLCSTLYADSFNRALRLSLGEINGICVPAWFSATEDFVDLDVGWLAIA